MRGGEEVLGRWRESDCREPPAPPPYDALSMAKFVK